MLARRDLLRALGAGAAVAALAPLGCGHGRKKGGEELGTDPDQVRAALRAAVTLLGERLAEPRAWVLARRRVRVLVDVAVADVVDERMTVAVLSARDESGRRIERCFDEVTPASIAAAAEIIGAGRGQRPGARGVIPPPVDLGAAVDADPVRLSSAEWLARARDISRRSERASTSRIVYRAAWLTTEEDRVWAVGEGGDRHQRLVRSRFGATLVAWHGSTPQFGEAEVCGGFGPAVERLDDDAIARAAGEALALFTPGVPPDGRQVVLLDPGVAAAVIEAYARSGGALAGVSPLLNITDDPAQPGYAHYWFDDDGATGGHARRSEPGWRLAPAPAQLFVAPGPASAAALEAGINDGLVIEGVRDVRVDDRGAAVVRVARGRQLAAGVRTGRQWGDLEVRGSARELLAGALGVSSERREIAFGAGAPRAVTAPWLLTRARVSSARGGV